ncbi:DUF4158 domain-containing protein [Saccharopolyspora elongata]|uniref:DUF4158 domain-containing protein n=1 Tax=Saccharopolyspora elongata TaxID=2530387 RepID=A0A4R4Y8T2_9PSEU|nr:DUF4158 domain-containing protein [Saccharopolyspora elongata]
MNRGPRLDTGDGPKALFDTAVAWLRERRVLRPGVTTLGRLVASRQKAATPRLWETLYQLLDDEQRAALDGLLEVPEGHRNSQLDKLRRPPTRMSGPAMVDAPPAGCGDSGPGVRRDRHRGGGAAAAVGRAVPMVAVGTAPCGVDGGGAPHELDDPASTVSRSWANARWTRSAISECGSAMPQRVAGSRPQGAWPSLPSRAGGRRRRPQCRSP